MSYFPSINLQKVLGATLSVTNPVFVSPATGASFAVTNAGTFVVQATLAAETTKVIGTVNISAGQTVAVTRLPVPPVTATGSLPRTSRLPTLEAQTSRSPQPRRTRFRRTGGSTSAFVS